jgi:hypothetical protein
MAPLVDRDNPDRNVGLLTMAVLRARAPRRLNHGSDGTPVTSPQRQAGRWAAMRDIALARFFGLDQSVS